MGLLLNFAALVTIWLAYSVAMAIAQNALALLAGLFRIPATRTVATSTASLSSLVATVSAVACAEYGVRALNGSLSVIPIVMWGLLQTAGAARSFGNHRSSLTEMGGLILSGGDRDAPRFVYVGQIVGLEVGLVVAGVLHFFVW